MQIVIKRKFCDMCTHTHAHTLCVGSDPTWKQKQRQQIKKKKRAKGAQIAGERSEIWSAIAFTNANVSAAFAFSHSAVESVHILLFFGGPNSPSGRTAGWLDGQRTDGRTDWTDGQAAASTALSTPQSPMLSTLDFRPGVRMPSMAFEYSLLLSTFAGDFDSAFAYAYYMLYAMWALVPLHRIMLNWHKNMIHGVLHFRRFLAATAVFSSATSSPINN